MRLVTRGDLDGLTCAVLITLHETIEAIELVHPQDIADRKIDIGPDDILANLPYHPECGVWFDHHHHTATPPPPENFKGAFGPAPSAARLVYEHYGGEAAMPQFAELVRETDRLDSADLTPIDVLRPAGYIQLGFTIDGRTGLGDYKGYFLTLMELLRGSPPVAEVLAHPDVRRRCQLIDELDGEFREELNRNSWVDRNVVVTDLRPLDHVPIGNRFMIYAIFPQVNVSARIQWGPHQRFPIMTLGHSIFNRTCKTNVGELAARYGGGGHRGAASIPLLDDAEQQIQLILAELKANG